MNPTYYLRNGKIQLKSLNPIEWEEWFDLLDHHLKMKFFATGNRVPLLPAQLTILGNYLQTKQQSIPYNLTLVPFQASLTSLLNKIRNFKGCELTLYIHLCRNKSQTEDQAGLSWLLFPGQREVDHLPLNQNGLFLTVAGEEPSAIHPPQYLQREIRFDAEGHITENQEGHMMIVKNGNLIGNSISRKEYPSALFYLAPILGNKLNLPFLTKTFIEKDLITADEIWWIDDLNGIQWLMAYKDKRYYRNIARKMAEELNIWIGSGDQFHIGSSG